MSEPAPLQPGHIIDGRYALESPIGEGGAAVVWRAKHLRLQTPVAIKLLRETENEELKERFLREARVAAAIRHRHVVDISDVGEQDGWAYMVMELLEGENLGDRLARGPLPIPEAIRITAQLLGGLTAVHDAGIVHRDLKPDNVILVRDADGSYPKIVDFGVSKVSVVETASGKPSLTSVIPTQENVIVGTPEYMAPEQVRAKSRVSAATDVYAMGVSLYEMLAGDIPFDAESTADLLIQVATEEARPVTDYRPEVGPTLEAFVAKAMSKEVPDRFPNARAMRQALIATVMRAAAEIEAEGPRGKELADSMRRAVSAAYEPGDSAIIHIGKQAIRDAVGRERRPHTTPGLEDEVLGESLPSELPRSRTGSWLAAAAASLALVGGLLWWGMRGEPDPQAVVTPEPTSESPTVEERVEAEAEPPPPTAAPPPANVSLVGLPEGAEVRLDGQPHEGSTLAVPRDGEAHAIEVSAPGHRPWRVERVIESDLMIQVAMEERRSRRATAMRASAMRASEPAPTRATTMAEEPAGMESVGGVYRDPGF